MIGAVLMSALVCGGVPHSPSSIDRPLATRPVYPVAMADDVRRPGFNGKLFVTRPIMGQMPADFARPMPELDTYGAYLTSADTIPARVGHLVISISPWHPWTEQGHRRLEEARQLWLLENGYTGGVRTHINDAYLWRELEAPNEPPQVAAPEPAAVIELAPDVPRGKNRMRVDSAPDVQTMAAVMIRDDGLSRVSLPHAASRVLEQRLAGGIANATTVATR